MEPKKWSISKLKSYIQDKDLVVIPTGKRGAVKKDYIKAAVDYLSRESSQKKQSSDELSDSIKALIDEYLKQRISDLKPEIQKQLTVNGSSRGNMTLENESWCFFAIKGGTKSDKLDQLGARWEPNLKGGGDWIIHKEKRREVEAFLLGHSY